MKFNWPQNGKIILIDDKIEEVLPIIKFFSKLNIAVKYFDGDSDLLPEHPSEDPVIIFSDIVLIEGIGTKSKTAAIVGVISEIIKKNIPYILILWTKNLSEVEQMKNDLDEMELKPVEIIPLDKMEYIEINSDGTEIVLKEDAIKNLEENIHKKLDMENSLLFKMIFSWQNNLIFSLEKLLIFLNSLNKENKEWNKYYKELFYNFAKAHLGKMLQIENKKIKKEEFLKCAFVINEMLVNEIITLNREINCQNEISIEDCLEDLPNEIISEINTKILTREETDINSPGSLYEVSNLEGLKYDYFDNCYQHNIILNKYIDEKATTKQEKKDLREKIDTELTDERKEFIEYKKSVIASDCKIKLYLLEISPNCDFAQKKLKFNRYIIGIGIHSNTYSYKKNETCYKIPTLKIKNDYVDIIFDSKYFFVPFDNN